MPNISGDVEYKLTFNEEELRQLYRITTGALYGKNPPMLNGSTIDDDALKEQDPVLYSIQDRLEHMINYIER